MTDEEKRKVVVYVGDLDEKIDFVRRQSLLTANYDVFFRGVKRAEKAMNDLVYVCEQLHKRYGKDEA